MLTVPNAPFRERAELLARDPDFSFAGLARQVHGRDPQRYRGYVDPNGKARTKRVKTDLGLYPTTAGTARNGVRSITEWWRSELDYDLACAYAELLGLDPFEAGV